MWTTQIVCIFEQAATTAVGKGKHDIKDDTCSRCYTPIGELAKIPEGRTKRKRNTSRARVLLLVGTILSTCAFKFEEGGGGGDRCRKCAVQLESKFSAEKTVRGRVLRRWPCMFSEYI